jgi:hypothetical protein
MTAKLAIPSNLHMIFSQMQLDDLHIELARSIILIPCQLTLKPLPVNFSLFTINGSSKMQLAI